MGTERIRVFVAFLRDSAKDANYTSADLQPMHVDILRTNKFFMTQKVLEVLGVYKVR